MVAFTLIYCLWRTAVTKTKSTPKAHQNKREEMHSGDVTPLMGSMSITASAPAAPPIVNAETGLEINPAEADVSCVFVEQVFDTTQRRWKLNVHHHGELDDF